MSDRKNVPDKNSGSDTPASEAKRSRTGLSTFDFKLSTSAERDSRRARIIKLTKDNREVTIKDISTHFPDLSEKTIQRELVSLTEEGVLKKSGERRWSRYMLA